MRRVKKYWMVVLLGALLMATLVGVAGARPNERPMAAISRRITIPAGHFIPTRDDWDYINDGLHVQNVTGSAQYTAPVVFPTGQSVVVESVTLYVLDNHGVDEVCLALRRMDPTEGSEVLMSSFCSSGASSGVRSFSDSSIDNNPVKHGKGVYLWLNIQEASTNLKAYGVRIQYHHGTT